MIKNLIFDIGSVLVNFNYNEFLHYLGYSEEICRELNVINEGGPFWLQMDLGYKDEPEGLADYLEMIPVHKEEAKYAFLRMAYYMELIEDTADFMRAAKEKGYHLYYLSNYSRYNWKILNERFDAFKLFDGGWVSFEAHEVKPEPQIYKMLLDKYGLVAEESLFVDDKKKNTKTAEELGFHTITLKEGQKVSEEMKRKGILV